MSERVVVVTGASSGIGRAAAKAFAARGDRLVLAARSEGDLHQVAAECGGTPLIVPTDVTKRADLEALRDATVAEFGQIDVWADTAAVMAYGRFEDVPAEVFDRVITTDLLGSANVARVALGQFRDQEHGTLILCSSLLAHITAPYMSAYITAKWGLRGLARTLAQEARETPGVHVCTVAPGSVDTPVYTSAANYAGFVGRPPPPVDRPERVAAAILRQADKPGREISVGPANRFIEFGFTALPRVYDVLVPPMMRRFGLSREPVSRHPGNVFGPAKRVEGGPGRPTWRQVTAVATGGLAAAAVLSQAVRRLSSS